MTGASAGDRADSDAAGVETATVGGTPGRRKISGGKIMGAATGTAAAHMQQQLSAIA